MVLKGFFDRFGRRRDEVNESAVIGNDGWVEILNGKMVVHDPAEDGRYPTLIPEPGVRLWINDEEVSEPTAVTASDQIRYEVADAPLPFFELQIADDAMSAELLLTGEPAKLPDMVNAMGRHQVRLVPGCSTRARPRPGSPRQLILDALRDLGVVYGIDEAAIDQELANPTGSPVEVARGQEARAPQAGQWVWRLDEWSSVEAGQVIAAYQGGVENLPRITVKGESTKLYEDLPEPQVYLPGNGTRLVPGGRLVASASGRARAVPTPQGQRVHIFPLHRVGGDLEGELNVPADVIVLGNVRGAKLHSTGEVLVTGNVEKSEIRAEVITVRGAASDSRLCTIESGHFLPLRHEIAWVQQQVESMRDTLQNNKSLTEEKFREVQTFVRALRRKAEQMSIAHPDFAAANEEVARVFMGAQGLAGLDLPAAGRLLLALGKLMKAADQALAGARDVRAASLAHATVWAGRDIHVQEKVNGCFLFAGGAIRTPATASLSQSELVAAGEVIVGALASVRGTAPVTIRAGGRMEAEEVQVGCAFEFGLERREFKSDLQRVVAGPNAKGQLIIRQKD